MAWEHLSINRPHLVYIILGGFTSIFMLCSSIIKERLYIGEATVATLVGIIFGPHAADLIDPLKWGNTDQITLEFSRIVLVVQCFAVGVELPRNYMEKHWRSVTFLLVPVMTFGWLITSLFVWAMFSNRLDWLDSLCVAACVTATDPVLASSVVGKGKFAKRVPKHLRDLLSAESGCNDGMAFPFIYLAIYIIRYRHHPGEVAFHWFCYTILYECIFGAVYGVLIGYIARRAIRSAHERDYIDRESFLVFYFVLALFCAGSGAILGLDDLLVGFACGVGFSNDGWFQEKTEETHVSNVIDLLINLAFFVYFGTIIPWAQYNSDILGITPWRLVVVGLLVLFFRRIPIMMVLKPVIPDIKTWREALFAGHFGPIGVGAIFVAILARAELETGETTPLAEIPPPDFPHANIIELIWPITTFLVICSIIVHGSSIAVFTLGKHINTLNLTLSYTQGGDDTTNWMDRIPRIQSRSRTSMSLRPPEDTDSEFGEKAGELPPIGVPGNFLRRQKEEESSQGAARSRRAFRNRKKWDTGIGPGGPVSQSAIRPRPRREESDGAATPGLGDSGTLAVNSDESPSNEKEEEVKRPRGEGDEMSEPEEEIYQEGDDIIIEDHDGNVLAVEARKEGESEQEQKRRIKQEAKDLIKEKDIKHGIAQADEPHPREDELDKIASAVKDAAEHPAGTWKGMRKWTEGFAQKRREDKEHTKQQKRGPALAYQFGNTIIVEDEDGEVLKKYDISQRPRQSVAEGATWTGENQPPAPRTRATLQRMGTYLGMASISGPSTAGPKEGQAAPGPQKAADENDDDDDDRIRFISAAGRRMSKLEFIEQIQRMDPRARAKMVEDSNAPEALKKEVRRDAKAAQDEQDARARAAADNDEDEDDSSPTRLAKTRATVERVNTRNDDRKAGPEGLTLVDSDDEDIPFHPVSDDLARFRFGAGGKETPAQRRRRMASANPVDEEDEDEEPTQPRRRVVPLSAPIARGPISPSDSSDDEAETAAERARRLDALGKSAKSQSSTSGARPGIASPSSSEDEDGAGPSSGKPRNPERAMERRQTFKQERAREAALSAGRGVRVPEQVAVPSGAGARTSIRFAADTRGGSNANANAAASPAANVSGSGNGSGSGAGTPAQASGSGSGEPSPERGTGNGNGNGNGNSGDGGNASEEGVRRSRLRWGRHVKK